MELVKLMVLTQDAGQGQIPSESVPHYVGLNADSELMLEFVSDEGAVSGSVDRATYDMLTLLVRNREPVDRGLRVIDRRWVDEFFTGGLFG